MIIIIGSIVVMASVLGGFVMAGGHVAALIQVSEFIVICGAAAGSLVIMSPKKVLLDMAHQIIHVFKGGNLNKAAYEELFKALYELFMLGRRNGMIGLEEHVMNPQSSSIFTKYPTFLNNKDALNLLCGGLRPLIDGRVKPDQMQSLLQAELDAMEEEHHKPIDVLTKTSDAMPGFGIVAAVLGIVNTMAAIAGPIEKIGLKVAAALVGTFLGIFLAYGFVSPLATNMEFNMAARLAYFRCISTAIVGFAGGMAPGMSVELARRSLSEELRPDADELEEMLRPLNAGTGAPKK